jgi:N-acetylneuraminate synthase
MQVEIEGKKIGDGNRPYFIAEISGNHNGKIENALKLIRLAKESGADAVKLQTYTPETMTIECDSDLFKVKGGLWDSYSLYDLYQWAHTPWEWHAELFAEAKKLGITCFSTPFDESAVDFLEGFKVPAYKVASFEIVDLLLIERIAQTMKPIIMSTGMANHDEIKEAIDTVKKYHNDIVVLHCVSGYPTPVEQSNIRTIPRIRQDFDVLTGLSDHTLSSTAAIASVSLGSCLIEKHFIDDRSNKGPDSEFSLNPTEFRFLVKEMTVAWHALGEGNYELKKAEKDSIIFRRSLFFTNDIKSGEIITKENLRKIRPGNGLPPKYYEKLIGKKVTKDVKKGTPADWGLIQD